MRFGFLARQHSFTWVFKDSYESSWSPHESFSKDNPHAFLLTSKFSMFIYPSPTSKRGSQSNISQIYSSIHPFFDCFCLLFILFTISFLLQKIFQLNLNFEMFTFQVSTQERSVEKCREIWF